MGVTGLETILASARFTTRCFVEAIHRADCPVMKLVVDGGGWLFFLYESSKLDWARGGQYEEFYDFVCEQLSWFSACRIELHVVLDGAPLNNDKTPTMFDRHKRDLTLYKNIWDSLQAKETFNQKPRAGKIPVLAKRVLLDALRARDVSFVVVDGEADPFCATYAKTIGAFGVLSSYWRENTLTGLFDVPPELFPLFAVMVGTDRTKSIVDAQGVKGHISRAIGREENEEFAVAVGRFLSKIQASTSSEAFHDIDVKKVFPSKTWNDLRELFGTELEFYCPNPLSLSRAQAIGQQRTDLIALGVPAVLADCYQHGDLDPDLVGLVRLRNYVCRIIIDAQRADLGDKHVWKVTRQIRQRLLSVLVGPAEYTEFFQVAGSFTQDKFKTIPLEHQIPWAQGVQVSQSQKIEILLSILDLRLDTSSSAWQAVPSSLRAGCLATVFVVSRMCPMFEHEFVALVLMMVICSVHKQTAVSDVFLQDPAFSVQKGDAESVALLWAFQVVLKTVALVNDALARPLVFDPRLLVDGRLFTLLTQKSKGKPIDVKTAKNVINTLPSSASLAEVFDACFAVITSAADTGAMKTYVKPTKKKRTKVQSLDTEGDVDDLMRLARLQT